METPNVCAGKEGNVEDEDGGTDYDKNEPKVEVIDEAGANDQEDGSLMVDFVRSIHTLEGPDHPALLAEPGRILLSKAS
jgi:hypothetical protein